MAPILVIGLAALLPPDVRAQASSPVPMSAGGQIPRPIPSSEALQENVFGFGVLTSASYDSNVFTSSQTGAHSDIRYSITPNVFLSKSLPRFSFDLKYSPGVEISQHRLYHSQFSNDFDGGFVYTPTDRTSFTARQGYTVSTNPFRGLGGPIGPLGQSSFLPNFKQTSLLSNANLSHRFSEFSTLGIGGMFADRQTESQRTNQPTVNLIRSRISLGNAFYTYQVSPKNSMGVQYQAQALEFPQQSARTFTHSIYYLDVVTFSRRSNLTLFGGPDYSITNNQVVISLGGIVILIPIKKSGWSGSGGAIYSYLGDRTAFQGEFSRRVSEGGGLLGAVYQTSERMELALRLTKNWDLDLSGSGAVSTLISATGSASPQLLRYGGGAGLSRSLGRNVSLNFSYRRENQSASNLNEILGNHNIAEVGLDFHFLRPLGR
jgi:hypothetical protein